MPPADHPRDPAAWTAEQQRWYASLVAHCNGFSSMSDDPKTVLSEVGAKPFSECLHMVGDADLEGRVEDSDGRLWSTDQNGRWFATVDRKVVWLQRELVRIGYGHLPRGGDVVSHICGNCDCMRVQHLRVQSRSEDARDRVHHRAQGAGQIRSTERSPKSPVTESVCRSKRVRSPCHE